MRRIRGPFGARRPISVAAVVAGIALVAAPFSLVTAPAPAAAPPTAAPAAAAATATAATAAGGDGGYWLVDGSGATYAFGGAAPVTAPVPATVVAIDGVPGGGVLFLTRTGQVIAANGAAHFGDVPDGALAAGEVPSSISVHPTGLGYWVFTNRGRVFAFGAARHLGDLAGIPLNGPVLASVATPSGQGYYMIGSDGGVFAFGDAQFSGSMGGSHLNAPIVGIAPDPDGVGYWLVASDGGIFAFDAPFRGSVPGVLGAGQALNRPVIGAVAYGDGYLMVGSDGGVFNFSDELFGSSLGSDPPSAPVVGIAVVRPGNGPRPTHAAERYRVAPQRDGETLRVDPFVSEPGGAFLPVYGSVVRADGSSVGQPYWLDTASGALGDMTVVKGKGANQVSLDGRYALAWTTVLDRLTQRTWTLPNEGALVHTINLGGLPVMSPDGTRFVTGSPNRGVQVRDLRTGALLTQWDVSPVGKFFELQHASPGARRVAGLLRSITDTPESFVIGGPDDRQVVLDTTTGAMYPVPRASASNLGVYAFNRELTRVAIRSSDSYHAQVFDVASGRLLLDVLETDATVSLSPAGRLLLVRHKSGARVYDVDSGDVLIDLPDITTGAFVTDDFVVVNGPDGSLRGLDLLP